MTGGAIGDSAIGALPIGAATASSAVVEAEAALAQGSTLSASASVDHVASADLVSTSTLSASGDVSEVLRLWATFRGRQGGFFSLYYGSKSGPPRHLVESQVFGWNYVAVEPTLVQTSSMNTGVTRSRFGSSTAFTQSSMVVVDDTYRRPHLWHLLRGAQGNFHSQFFGAKGPALRAIVQNRALTSAASRGGQGLLTATSSLTATGSGVFFSFADLVSSSSFSGAGQVTVSGSPEMSSTSSLGVGGDVTRVSSGELSQDSALLADPVVTRIGSADLSSASTLTAVGEAGIQQAFLSSESILVAEGIAERLGSADISQGSSLTVDGQVTRVAQADLVAASTMASTGEVDIPVGFASSSTLSATGFSTLYVGADLTSGSSLAGDGAIVKRGTSFLYGVSSLTAAGATTPPSSPSGGGAETGPLIDTSYTAFSNGADDDNTYTVDLGFTITVGNNTTSIVYINNNGYLTFGAEAWEYLGPISNIAGYTGVTGIFAPFFADVLTRRYGGYMEYGPGTFGGNAAYFFTWPGVGSYATDITLVDTFQMIIVDQGSGDFDLIYNYQDMQWDNSTAGYTGSGTGACVGFWYYDVDGVTEVSWSGGGDNVDGYYINGGEGDRTTGHLNSSMPGRWHFYGRDGVLSTEPPTTNLVSTSSLSVDVYVGKTLSQESALIAIPYHSIPYPSSDLYPWPTLFPAHGPIDANVDLVSVTSLWAFSTVIPGPVSHLLQRTSLATTAWVNQIAAADLAATAILSSGGQATANAYLVSSSSLDAQILLGANAQAELTSTTSLNAEAVVVELPRAAMISSSILTAVSTIEAQGIAAFTSTSTFGASPTATGRTEWTSTSALEAVSGSADYPDTVMFDAPFLYWRLEERENEWVALDATGNGRDGLVINDPVWQSPGLIGTGYSFRFNGNNYVEISYNSWRVWDQSLNNGNGGYYFPFGATHTDHQQISVDGVIEPFTVGVGGAMAIVERSSPGWGSWELSISAAGYLQWVVYTTTLIGDTSVNGSVIAIGTTVLQRDRRYYVAATYGADLVARLYLQGQEEAVSAVGTGRLQGPAYDLMLGHGRHYPNFYGYMDEFAYYDHALTAGQIATRFKAIDSPAAISVQRNAAADLAQTSSLTVAKVDAGTVFFEVSSLTVNTVADAQAQLASSSSLFSVADAFVPGTKPWAFGTLVAINGLPWNSSNVGNEPVQLVQTSSMSTTGDRTFGGNGVEMVETSTLSTGVGVAHFAVALLIANTVMVSNVPSPIILSLKSISTMAATCATSAADSGADALLILYAYGEGKVTADAPLVASVPAVLLTGSRTFD